MGPHAEGDHRPGSLHHQDQDHRSPREEVLRLDRRLHPGFPLHLPADVDLQAGVRRVRTIHRPPQVPLRNLTSDMFTFCLLNLLKRGVKIYSTQLQKKKKQKKKKKKKKKKKS